MRKILLLILMLVITISAMGQATSLVVDNQTPGWLSSKINYGDQQTLVNLKVTGYINNTDLTFIGQLMSERSLNGILDLGNANIVGSTKDEDNFLTNKDGLLKGKLSHYILPESIDSAYQVCKGISIDTITIGGSALANINSNTFYSSVGGSNFNRNVKILIIRDGVVSIEKEAFKIRIAIQLVSVFLLFLYQCLLRLLGKVPFRIVVL